jgi:hypothetical protein
MNDQIDDQLPLDQYLARAGELLADPASSGFSATQFVGDLFKYPEGKAYFIKNADIANAILTAETQEEAVALAKSIAENPVALLRHEPPEARHTREEELSANKILGGRNRDVDQFSTTIEEFQPSLLKRRRDAVAKQRTFIADLVKRYGNNLRQEQRDLITQELSSPPKSTALDEAHAEYRKRIQESAALAKDIKALEIAKEIIEANSREIIEEARSINLASERVVIEYLKHPDSPPELTEKIVTKTFSSTPQEHETAIREARIQYTASLPVSDTGKIPLAQAYPEYKQEKNKEAAINRAFSTRVATVVHEKNIEKVVKKAGEVGIESETMHVALKRAKEEAIKRSGGATHLEVGIFTSAPHAPHAPPPAPDKDTMDYIIGLVSHDAIATPSPHGLFQSIAHANDPAQFNFQFAELLNSWTVNVGRQTVKKVTVSGASKATIKKLGTDFLLKLGFGSTSKVVMLFSGWVGWIVYGVTVVFPGFFKSIGKGVGKIVGGIANGGFSTVRAATGAISESIQGALGTKYEDPLAANGWLFALVLALSPVFLAVFLTLGLFQMTRAQFFPVGVGGGPPDGTPDQSGVVIDCAVDTTNPQCVFTPCVGDCRWPTSGVITQGPHTETTCGGNVPQSSHDAGTAANGIDFGGLGGSPPVYSPRSGTITQVENSCTDNSGFIGSTCGGGYGNFVKIQSDDGYLMMFGHLSSAINITDEDALKPGVQVGAGSQIGWMDQTGNSTGSHLHFGVLSGQSVLDLIPADDPGHTPEQIRGCLAACGKPCPGGAVSP